MKKISAWLEIDGNNLPDFISSMLFQPDPSREGWIPVAVSESAADSGSPPIKFSSDRSALVRLELPNDMRCVTNDTPDEIIPLSRLFTSEKSGSDQAPQPTWVPCLPAIFAREVLFADETTSKGVESNLRRLMQGRGEWLKLRVMESSQMGPSIIELNSEIGHRLPESANAVRLEKLASAVATGVVFGHTDIGKNRIVTFDTGSIALLRQILSGDLIVSNQKTLEADIKQLVKDLLKTAREKGLNPGTLPRKISGAEVGALQLARILQVGGANQNDLFQDTDKKAPEGDRSLDQKMLEFILRRLIDEKYFPTIENVGEILEEASRQLAPETAERNTARGRMREALQSLMANVESPEDRIDRFQDSFGDLPGITGIAHVFWGWSASPLDNFEQRLVPLKSASRRAHQVANIVYSAASGAGRLPTRFFRSRLWMAVYESAWELLLSKGDAEFEDTTKAGIWAHEKGELRHSDRGPMVEIRIHDGRIPLGLGISDPLLVVQSLAMDILRSEKFGKKAAAAILDAMKGDTSTLTGDLKGLLETSLTVRLGRNLSGEIKGSSIVFRNVRDSDLTFNYRWSDPSEAARKLAEGKALPRILEALPKERLKQLRMQLTDWSEHQSA